MNYYRFFWLMAASCILAANSFALSLKCDIELAKSDDRALSNAISLGSFTQPIEDHEQVEHNLGNGFTFIIRYHHQRPFNSINVRAFLIGPQEALLDSVDIQGLLYLQDGQFMTTTTVLRSKINLGDGIERNRAKLTCTIIS